MEDYVSRAITLPIPTMNSNAQLMADLLEHNNALANATYQIDFERGKITGGFAPFVTPTGEKARFLIWGEIATIWTENVRCNFRTERQGADNTNIAY